MATEQPTERGIVDDIANRVEAGIANAQDTVNDVTGGVTNDIENAANDATRKYKNAVNDVAGKFGDVSSMSSSHRPMLWLGYMLIASAVLLGASTRFAGNDYQLGDYCVSVAAVSLGLGLLMILWYKLNEGDNTDLRKKRFDMPVFGDVTLEMIIAAFFTVWWIVGACIITFEGPHLSTGNGYFAAWAGAFAAVGYLADASGRSMSSLGESVKRGQGTLNALALPSIVLIIATTKQNCTFGTCVSLLDFEKSQEEAAYGLSVGVISLVFILLLALLGSCEDRDLGNNGEKLARNLPKIAAAIMVCLWIVACIILTFHEPFTGTGNGYFACWLGLVLSFAYAVQQIPELRDAIDDANK